MTMNSQLIHHNQAIISDPALEALKLYEVDAIDIEIDQAGAHLRKALL
jgi:hypothetical protein